MIKNDLIERVSAQTGLNKAVVKQVVERLLGELRQALIEGQRIELRNFGVFTVKRRRQKIGRNPKTGQTVPIPERNKVLFKPSKVFKRIAA